MVQQELESEKADLNIGTCPAMVIQVFHLEIAALMECFQENWTLGHEYKDISVRSGGFVKEIGQN